ncbi:MAG: lipoate--protein ligase family protein [Chloroflexota bacterium]|nr:lipoate--protein ligase family protein [Chloroflexota bacterium]
MAVDEVLLESVIAGGPPVVRFYSWEPATLSLGVNQPMGEVNRDSCRALGFELVRRITGGRAVLHQHELTYSLVARENDPRVSGGVVESYRKISLALVAGLRTLGVDVALAPPDRAMYRALAPSRRHHELDEPAETGHGAVCFDATSAYELTAGGRKLVGSAQARRSGVLLQHGSILLDIDWDAWVEVFSYATEAGKQRARRKLPTRMTSLKQELGSPVSPGAVEAALRQSLQEALQVSLERSGLSAIEETSARRLAAEKYAGEAWTVRG